MEAVSLRDIIDTLLISEFFTFFVPKCSQFWLYSFFLGEFILDQNFSANDLLLKGLII